MVIFFSVIILIVLIITGILISGKGAGLVTGFNTLPSLERDKYDSKRISRHVGVVLLIIDIPLIIFVYLLYVDKLTDSYGIFSAIFIVIVVCLGNIGKLEKYKKI